MEHRHIRCSGQSRYIYSQSFLHPLFQEWKDAAATLDRYLQFDEWKKVDEDAFYDWKLVRKVKRSLRTLRENKDARGIRDVLETCIRANFAGVESPR